jgi:hypothetical protein
MTPEAKMLWVALGTVCVLPAIAAIRYLAFCS